MSFPPAIWTREGWLCLAVMLDLYSRRVVAWAASANNDTLLALDALRVRIAIRFSADCCIVMLSTGSGDLHASVAASSASTVTPTSCMSTPTSPSATRL